MSLLTLLVAFVAAWAHVKAQEIDSALCTLDGGCVTGCGRLPYECAVNRNLSTYDFKLEAVSEIAVWGTNAVPRELTLGAYSTYGESELYMKSPALDDSSPEVMTLSTSSSGGKSAAKLEFFKDAGGAYLNTYGSTPGDITIQAGGDPVGAGGVINIIAGETGGAGDISIIAGNSITLNAKTVNIAEVSAANFTNTKAAQYWNTIADIQIAGSGSFTPYLNNPDGSQTTKLLVPGLYALYYKDGTNNLAWHTLLISCQRAFTSGGVETRRWDGKSNAATFSPTWPYFGIYGSSEPDNTIWILNGTGANRIIPNIVLSSLMYYPSVSLPIPGRNPIDF